MRRSAFALISLLTLLRLIASYRANDAAQGGRRPLVVQAMRDRSDPPDIMLGAIGLALIAVGIVTAAGWGLIVPGCVALLVSLPGAWLIQKSRDRTLR